MHRSLKEKEIREKVARDYPEGTRFYPAHLCVRETICTMWPGKEVMINFNTDGSLLTVSLGHGDERNGHLFSEHLYSTGDSWAKIVEEEPCKFKKGDPIVMKEGNPYGVTEPGWEGVVIVAKKNSVIKVAKSDGRNEYAVLTKWVEHRGSKTLSGKEISFDLKKAIATYKTGDRCKSEFSGGEFTIEDDSTIKVLDNNITVDDNFFLLYSGEWSEILPKKRRIEDILLEAKERYPIGTIVDSLVSPLKNLTIIEHSSNVPKKANTIWFKGSDGFNILIYDDGKWAKIVDKVKKEENHHENVSREGVLKMARRKYIVGDKFKSVVSKVTYTIEDMSTLSFDRDGDLRVDDGGFLWKKDGDRWAERGEETVESKTKAAPIEPDGSISIKKWPLIEVDAHKQSHQLKKEVKVKSISINKRVKLN